MENLDFLLIFKILITEKLLGNSVFATMVSTVEWFDQLFLQFSSVQSLSRVRLFATPWTAVHQASLSITNSWSLLKLMSIESVMPSNHFILCCPLLLLPSVIPSIRVLSNESVLCIRWPKYWSLSFIISPSNGYSGLISFRTDCLDLLAVQGTLKSLQHHSLKASILRCSTFFIVQLSHPYMTREKPVLTRWTFVSKVMFLLFNMLSRLVITFPPRSKRLLISWLHSPSAVILEPRKIVSAYIIGQFLYLALTLPKFIILPDNCIAKENFNLRIQYTSLYCNSVSCISQILCFLQIKSLWQACYC